MNRRWEWVIAAGILVLVAWLGANPEPDPDTWWHLKTGQLILSTGVIPRTDPYSYVLNGARWVTFEWLFQVLLAVFWALKGTFGLAVLRGGTLCAAFLLFLRLAGGGFWGGALTALSALLLRDYFRIRPQVFDYLLIGLALTALDRRKGRAGRLEWSSMIAIQVVWVNLHGGAALVGAGLAGLKAIASWGEPGTSAARREASLSWLLLSGACVAAMLVNPHLAAVFTHAHATLSFEGKEAIREWAPMILASKEGAVLALGLFAAALSWRADGFLTAVAVAFGVMAARQVRHTPFAVLAIMPLAARCAQRLKPVKPGRRAALGALAAGALLAAGFVAYQSAYTDAPGTGLDGGVEADAAVKYLDDNGVDGRMFHSYRLGGYLIWRAWPKRKVFIDGRNVEYGADFIRDAIRWQQPDAWARLDAKWKFDYAVLSNSAIYEARAFDESPDWALVFWDDAALVYLRRTPANAALIARDAYKLLRPNRVDFEYLKGRLRSRRDADGALAELERAERGSPANFNASQVRAYLLAALGRRPEAGAVLEEALKRFPRKPGPYMSLGWFYEQDGRLADAVKVYERGAEVARWSQDGVTEAYIDNNLGSVEARLGHKDRARKLFEACLRRAPHHPQARENLRRLDKAAPTD